tara:strand:+ start:1077 stop:1412 length:336 start_codon:yes stop_codon:yes gene_type:complete
MRTPSIKALRALFGDNAKQAKTLLTMTRLELIATTTGAVRVSECYHRPQTYDIRLTCLNDLGNFYGVEGFETKLGNCFYLNTGDTYTPTLIYFNGNYCVACWGDIAERHGL